MRETSFPDKVVAIGQALERAKLPHAFGGALALAYYAEPRATVDIDVNVFVPTSRAVEAAAALQPLGVVATLDAKIDRDGQCRWWWGRTPVDLFFSYDAVHDAMSEGVRRVPFGEDWIPILGPEHLVVCKAAFNRPKDWLDIEQVLVCERDLDRREVQRWLGRLVGVDDSRWRQFRELADQYQ